MACLNSQIDNLDLTIECITYRICCAAMKMLKIAYAKRGLLRHVSVSGLHAARVVFLIHDMFFICGIHDLVI